MQRIIGVVKISIQIKAIYQFNCLCRFCFVFKHFIIHKPAGNIDYASLAKASSEFSGADLKAVIDVAVEEKLRQSFDTGKILPIENKDLASAIKQIKPSTKEWFNTARNYALYANDSGLYDEILDYLKIKK